MGIPPQRISHAWQRSLLQLLLFAAPLFLVSLLSVSIAYAQSPAGGGGDVPPVYLPFIGMATRMPPEQVQGKLRLGDAPLAGAKVELRTCDADVSVPTTVLSATTNVEGDYIAMLPETISQLTTSEAISLEVILIGTAGISTSEAISMPFASFRSHCAPIGSQQIVTLPDYDLASPVFVSPTLTVTVDMPVTFGWRGREARSGSETLQWFGSVQFDCGTCAPVAIASQVLTGTATMVEWCSIAPHPSGATDVAWVDFYLRVSNALGVGESAVRRAYIGTTMQECPPLPPEPAR